uniref:PUB domain-containing protein n=1 Tax=Clastoptera arizonana TaxID=38151 RepID=A0A1B6DSL4_9HEMI
MADKIKKFFEKKKAEAKFKKAGPGHRLNESRSESLSQKSSSSGSVSNVPRAPLSAEAKQAAAAALARLEGGKTNAPAFNTSLAAIQAKVKRELEAEKKLAAAASEMKTESESESSFKEFEASPILAVKGVYFKCPLIGPEILSKEEWRVKIKDFLYEQLGEERGLTACLIIHSCNKNKDKVEQCVETLCKYLENIVHNPDEDKYQRIRMSNRIFQEKVVGIEGALEFLSAAGFKQQMLPFQDSEDSFLVFDKNEVEDMETLNARKIVC